MYASSGIPGHGPEQANADPEDKRSFACTAQVVTADVNTVPV